MQFGALGDIHGDFDAARRIMERHRKVPFWLCVGDVADAEGRYDPLPSPLYWIKGNNENFDLIAEWGEPVARGPAYENLGYVPNGRLIAIPLPESLMPESLKPGTLRVAGLGGTYAPTMYDLRAADLPHPRKTTAKTTAAADRRRHFVREEVEACKGIREVDVFLSHEAPRPFRVGRGIDAGKTPINEVLSAMKPRLHLFGHHHRFVEAVVAGVRSICLDSASVSYLLIDGKTLKYQHLAS